MVANADEPQIQSFAAEPVPLFQLVGGGNPPRRDNVCQITAVASKRGGGPVVHPDFGGLPSAAFAAHTWIDNGANLILLGGPGGVKSHLSSAIGLALVENGWRVMFTRTSDLVQRLQVARRELALEATTARLDRFDLLILEDFAYISKNQAETSVLFELISARYERRSMLITANQPFGE